MALALSILAFRFCCLPFMILRVSVGGHHLLGHVDLSSEVATVCDNWYFGVLQRVVFGVRKSFPRPFVS